MPDITIKQFLHDAKAELASITHESSLEAEVLLAHFLDKPRSFLHTWPEKKLTKEQIHQLSELINRRRKREPVAYITGKQEFWSLQLLVTSQTLIPRPETELLVETALTLLGNKDSNIKVADLGTGSGAISLALGKERPDWKIFATDISEQSLCIAKNNAERLALKNISFFQGNWCDALPCKDFNIIISNPPYIAETEWHTYSENLSYEPKHALLSGKDGLNAIREISQTVKNYLQIGGYVLIEHGFLQGLAVRELLTQAGFRNIYTLRDLSGQERVTLGCYS